MSAGDLIGLREVLRGLVERSQPLNRVAEHLLRMDAHELYMTMLRGDPQKVRPA